MTRGNNSASIAITSNGDGGTAITSYRVTCRSSNGGLTRSTTGASSPVTISSLSNGRAYTCTVVATNDDRQQPGIGCLELVRRGHGLPTPRPSRA